MTAGTITRIIVLVLALTNQVLSVMGKSPIPIADDEVEMLVSSVFTVIAALVAAWKNNSVTREAQRADEYLKELKEQ